MAPRRSRGSPATALERDFSLVGVPGAAEVSDPGGYFTALR
jgi:hypothetical protein